MPASNNGIHNLMKNTDSVTEQLNNIIRDYHIEIPPNLTNNTRNRKSIALLSPQHIQYWAYIAKHWPTHNDGYVCNLKHNRRQPGSIPNVQALKNHALRCHIPLFMCNNCHALIFGTTIKEIKKNSEK